MEFQEKTMVVSSTEVTPVETLKSPREKTKEGLKTKPEILLIPFDPESPEHVERVLQQRIACGWKNEPKDIEKWRVLQREGKMCIHWVTIPPMHPLSTPLLHQHTTSYPNESTTLSDTALTINGHPRPPSRSSSALLSTRFIPVGHISIDAYSPITGLTDPRTHRYAISTFYISRAIHGIGLGGLAMRAAEKMAVELLGAKCLSLNTVEKGAQRSILEERGLPLQEYSTQEWYENMGYRVFNESEVGEMKDGEWITFPSVEMEKYV